MSNCTESVKLTMIYDVLRSFNNQVIRRKQAKKDYIRKAYFEGCECYKKEEGK